MGDFGLREWVLVCPVVFLVGCVGKSGSTTQQSDDTGDGGEAGQTDADGDGWTPDGGDCDDTDSSIHPEAEEVCDLVDQDCDGEIDEDDAIDALTWYEDADEDGYGDEDSTIEACEVPSGYTDDASDCVDGDEDINPSMYDDCNGVDDDCSGEVDDAGECGCDVYTDDEHGYLFCEDALAWEDALEYCYTYGYHLVTLDDATEAAFVDGMGDMYSENKWWIGLNDRDTEGTFVWEDGTAVSYTNWHSGEPNDWGGEDCGQLNRWGDGTWNDEPCSYTFYFICESW
ncbi:MAG: lectin-like protein [Myxococcota bacterium]|nr:lectin-like protein [Myxococcota bacterium]